MVLIKKMLFVCFLLFPFVAYAQSCPTGFVAVEYDTFVSATSGACPTGYMAHDVDTVCGMGDGVCWLLEQIRALCDAGVSNIKTSGGVSVPLYAEKETSPSLCVRYNNTTCYADLEPGQASGTINIKYNGVVYHTVE